MKLTFNGLEHSIEQGECNVWVTYDPIIPTLGAHQNLMTVGSSSALALQIVKQTGVKSDYTSSGLGDRAEAAILGVLGDYAPGPTYDRHLLQPGQVLLLVSEHEDMLICDFMFIEEEENE